MNPSPQSDETFEVINQLIWKHLEERDWHNQKPRNLATSISLEAGELLEHYQWGDTPIGSKKELASELADIFIYAFEFAQANNINIAESIRAKLAEVAQKYPAEQFKGKSKTEKQQAWTHAKTHHQKEGL